MCEDYASFLQPSKQAKLRQNHCVQTLAGILALKETTFKALPNLEMNFWDLEIDWTDRSKPFSKVKDYQILLSLSYGKDYALAMALGLDTRFV